MSRWTEFEFEAVGTKLTDDEVEAFGRFSSEFWPEGGTGQPFVHVEGARCWGHHNARDCHMGDADDRAEVIAWFTPIIERATSGELEATSYRESLRIRKTHGAPAEVAVVTWVALGGSPTEDPA